MKGDTEEDAPSSQQQSGRAKAEPLDEEGGAVAVDSGDVTPAHDTALPRSTSTLPLVPLRSMPILGEWAQQLMREPGTSYTISGDTFILGLKELSAMRRENENLKALLKAFMEKPVRKCVACMRLVEDLPEMGDEEFAAGGEMEYQKEHPVILDVWAENFDEAIEEIQSVLATGAKFFVALDTEFCRKDGVVDPRGAPRSADAHYAQACRIVDGGDLVQVGIFIANQNFKAACRKVIQFNLKFDASTRSSNSKNVAFLRDTAKLDLPKHASQGISLQEFISKINGSGLLTNNKITWVTFQAYSDFGYLIRGVEEIHVLPSSRWQFINLSRRYFPSSYDMKVFHHLGVRCRKPDPLVMGSGKLSALASGLGVTRLGEEHGSASDAHLTLGCLKQMMLSDPAAASELKLYKDIMYGVMPSLRSQPSPTSIEDVAEIDVWAHNIESELKIFSASFNCQTVLAAEIQFLDSCCEGWQSYATARKEANSGNVDVGIVVSDWAGNLAFGRTWIFHLRGPGDEQSGRISASRLGDILSSSGAVLSLKTTWTSSSGKCFLYLVPKLLTAGCLPLELPVFLNLCVALFPNFRVLQVNSLEQNVGRRAFATLEQFLAVCHWNPSLGWHYIYDLKE